MAFIPSKYDIAGASSYYKIFHSKVKCKKTISLSENVSEIKKDSSNFKITPIHSRKSSEGTKIEAKRKKKSFLSFNKLLDQKPISEKFPEKESKESIFDCFRTIALESNRKKIETQKSKILYSNEKKRPTKIRIFLKNLVESPSKKSIFPMKKPSFAN